MIGGDKKKHLQQSKKVAHTNQKKIVAAQQKTAAAVVGSEFDIKDIFGKLKSSASTTQKLQKSVQSENRTVAESTTDGLYRDRSATVEMSDDAFFGESASVDKTAKRKKKQRLADGESRRGASGSVGFDRIVTEDEIRKMTSSNAKAGTTPNCPFDCDCCF